MDLALKQLIPPKELLEIPGPRGMELLEWGKRFTNETLEGHTALNRAYGDIVACPWPNRMSIFLYKPEHIKRVLKDNHTNYQKGREYRHLMPLLGKGLLTSEGELWRKQRGAMAREFHRPRLEAYRGTIEELTDHFIHRLKYDGIATLEISEAMSDLTFRIAGRIFFGPSLGEHSDVVKQSLEYETVRANKRIRRAANLPRFFPTAENLRGEMAIRNLKAIVDRIFNNAKSSDSHLNNVLGRLLDSNMSEEQIKDEVMTLMLAGHETTSNALTWTLYLLAKNPEWQEHLASDKEGMVAMACFREAMRIFPPIPVLSRHSIGEDTIGGYTIPADVSIMAMPWVTHRSPDLWEDPLEFRPERFIKEFPADDYRYFPFAKGARACIGEELALLEGKIILQALFENFRFAPDWTEEPLPVQFITLKPKGGLPLKVINQS